jgi:DNA-binding transcriptional MerR regulator
VAAELAGLHPQTLRIYEREGLIGPARSAGGTRRYSRRDISRLQEICALTADGLNVTGIRRIRTQAGVWRGITWTSTGRHQRGGQRAGPGT